jgi:hypothetical protein
MPDQRVAVGYAVLFPVSMIIKVLLAQLMVVYLNFGRTPAREYSCPRAACSFSTPRRV